MSSLLSAVRAAQAVGLCVLPVREDGSKAPAVSSWAQFKTTRPTVQQMRAWDFSKRQGVGVIAGPVSQYVECWDFDDAQTFQAFVETAEAIGLAAVVQRIRDGYEDRTPGGGVRWLVKYPASVTWCDCTLARRPGRAGEPPVKTLIELPTFAIIAPSNGHTHPSGRPYTRVSGGFTTIATYTVEERDGLFTLARTFDEMPRREARRVPRSPSSTGRPGDDFNRRMTWPALLEPHAWTHLYDRGETSYWRRPGKDHGSCSATTNHAGTDLFYPFSSSTEFEPDTSYTKFGVYAVLEHAGDYTRAAKQLAAEGYGETANSGGAPTVSQRAPSASAPAATQTPPGARMVRLTAASTMGIWPVRWLWEDRLSLGSFSLLGGREGIGKTILADQLAADLTRGALPGVYAGQPRSVLIAATEDSWEHTITPRLMAAHADLTRVFRVDVVAPDDVPLSLTLPLDVAALEHHAREVGASLLVLDPLLSRLDARLDTHKDAEVRRALEPLSAMADAANLSVLGLLHVNKSASEDALNLLMASRAFPAVARNVLFVMMDPDDEAQRLLGQAKNNLGRMDLPTLVFRVVNTLVATTPEGPVWTGQLQWLPPSDRSLRDAIERAGTRTSDRTVVQDAAAWLEDYLTSEGGTAASKASLAAGQAAGHSRSTLYLAKNELALVSKYRGFPREAYWLLPPSSRPGNPRPESPDAFGTTEDVLSSWDSQRPGTTGTTEPQPCPPVVPTLGTPRTGILRTTGTTDDDLPPCLAELTVTDASDPIGQHDEEE